MPLVDNFHLCESFTFIANRAIDNSQKLAAAVTMELFLRLTIYRYLILTVKVFYLSHNLQVYIYLSVYIFIRLELRYV